MISLYNSNAKLTLKDCLEVKKNNYNRKVWCVVKPEIHLLREGSKRISGKTQRRIRPLRENLCQGSSLPPYCPDSRFGVRSPKNVINGFWYHCRAILKISAKPAYNVLSNGRISH